MSAGVVAVLETLQEALTLLTNPESGCAITPAPCRIELAPGSDVAWDSCEQSSCSEGNGQLWANVNSLTGSPGPTRCQTFTWSGTIGIVRCASGKLTDAGLPSVAAIEADAWQQAVDADAIRNALTCCTTRSEALRDVAVVTWIALGPVGGCVGGQWTVTGSVDVCC